MTSGRPPARAPGPAPRVTVAVPTWNRAHLVERAVQSVLAQTFPDFELLVVDDGSTDATPQVLGAMADPRIRCIRHAENRGISRTRNTAIAQARGEWIAFLDDDNEWRPDCLERQLRLAASRPAADVVYGLASSRDDRTGCAQVRPAHLAQGRVFPDVVEGWHLILSAAMIRRAVLGEIGGFDERLGASEDVDVWLQLARRAEFAGSPDVLTTRHDFHGGRQLSLDLGLRARDLALLDAKWRAEITAACGAEAYRRWRLRFEMFGGLRAVEAGQRLEALRTAWRMAGWLPWSAPGLARVLGATVLGPRAYARVGHVARRLLRR